MRSWLWLILFALQTFVPQIPALPSCLITLLPATLVTTIEWLSPWYNDCCYDRRGEEELLPLRLSRWMRKSHQPGAAERERARERERERERFSVALVFPHFSWGFVWFIFVAQQQRTTKLCGKSTSKSWTLVKEEVRNPFDMSIKKCPSFDLQAACLSGHCWCYWLFTTPLETSKVKPSETACCSQSCNQNKSAFTAQPLEMLSSSSVTPTESLWRVSDNWIRRLYKKLQALIQHDCKAPTSPWQNQKFTAAIQVQASGKRCTVFFLPLLPPFKGQNIQYDCLKQRDLVCKSVQI